MVLSGQAYWVVFIRIEGGVSEREWVKKENAGTPASELMKKMENYEIKQTRFCSGGRGNGKTGVDGRREKGEKGSEENLGKRAGLGDGRGGLTNQDLSILNYRIQVCFKVTRLAVW